ncbi:hypothetical protein JXB11_00850, partial [Candidatus Woesearchaeota archaeon]|nr:hypothetical protein [Candidatus Woesearchaeota archaeon]
SGERLLDIGKYGIFDTLNRTKLHASPNEKDKILKYNGREIYFIEQHPPEFGKGIAHFDSDRFNPEAFKIDLEDGLMEGRFYSKKVPKEEIGSEQDLWKRHLSQFSFSVDGKEYAVDNKKMDNWMHVESTRILDEKGFLVVEGKKFKKYIVDAVGFPEDLLFEKVPALGGG